MAGRCGRDRMRSGLLRDCRWRGASGGGGDGGAAGAGAPNHPEKGHGRGKIAALGRGEKQTGVPAALRDMCRRR